MYSGLSIYFIVFYWRIHQVFTREGQKIETCSNLFAYPDLVVWISDYWSFKVKFKTLPYGVLPFRYCIFCQFWWFLWILTILEIIFWRDIFSNLSFLQHFFLTILDKHSIWDFMQTFSYLALKILIWQLVKNQFMILS